MCESVWKETLHENMSIFESTERIELFNYFISTYEELLERKNTNSAHRLKGTCYQLGITPIAVISEKIEKEGGFENYREELKLLIDKIKKENLFMI